MEIISTINEITWPAAAAIIGSVVTAVVGLFGYLRSTKPREPSENVPSLKEPTIDLTAELLNIHKRISHVKDAILSIEGDIKVINTRQDGMTTIIYEHEKRDTSDFRSLNDKIDKIMQLIVELLRQ